MLLVLKRQKPIDAILAQGGSVILMSHLGRPELKKYSLKHILKQLQMFWENLCNLFHVLVRSKKCCCKITSRRSLLLENLRFHKEEEAGDVAFAKKELAYYDIYVNDALNCT
jgi:phosphoglycerate kinase